MIVHTYGTSEGTIGLAVAGEIDLATIGDFDAALAKAVTTDGTTRVLIDFGEVDFCDSSGLAALDRAFHQAAERGIELRVIRPKRAVYRLLELMGMVGHLTGPA